MPHSHLKCIGTRVTLPDGGEFLIVELVIDCPICGPYAVEFAGHHLRAIRDVLIEQIDLNPDLTGKEGDAKVISRLRIEGTPPRDPSSN